MTDDNNENKTAKSTKKCVIRFSYKYSLDEAQLENEINQLEKKLDIDSLRRKKKEFIKNNRLILKLQLRFRSEKHNVFTEEVNRIALNANDEKRLKSIDSTERFAYEVSKDLVVKRRRVKGTIQ